MQIQPLTNEQPSTTPAQVEAIQENMERLEQLIAQVLARTGMSEDEFADLFDLSKPFPFDAADRGGQHIGL